MGAWSSSCPRRFAKAHPADSLAVGASTPRLDVEGQPRVIPVDPHAPAGAEAAEQNVVDDAILEFDLDDPP